VVDLRGYLASPSTASTVISTLNLKKVMESIPVIGANDGD
jgi:hypothetical protein